MIECVQIGVGGFTLSLHDAYLDYFAKVGDPSLPRRLKLTNNEVTLKLVIERWQQASGDASDADIFPSFD